jgi:HSP20 family protein
MLSLNFFRELEQLPREFDSVFRGTELDRLLNRSGLPCFTASSSLQVNLREDDDNIYVEALVPGVDPTQIEMP